MSFNWVVKNHQFIAPNDKSLPNAPLNTVFRMAFHLSLGDSLNTSIATSVTIELTLKQSFGLHFLSITH